LRCDPPHSEGLGCHLWSGRRDGGPAKAPRLVGHVLQRLDPAADIPWHRVVNAKGEISYTLSRHGSDAFQQRLLEEEGVEFDDMNRFNLERFRWLE
jgi:methylated-DNA-protein-cysteine methyltransferase-like protein